MLSHTYRGVYSGYWVNSGSFVLGQFKIGLCVHIDFHIIDIFNVDLYQIRFQGRINVESSGLMCLTFEHMYKISNYVKCKKK